MKVTVERLSKIFKDHTTPVVNDVSFTIEDGEIMTLLGPSGCGKTTVLRILAGLESPSSGTIAVGEKTMNDVAANIFVEPHCRGIGMVFQNYALWPHRTAAQNIAFPLEIKKLPKLVIQQKVQDTLKLVDLSSYAHRYPQELSGGQQQRVALARAIVMEPHLLLLDEPLSNLDAKLRQDMRQELKALQQKLRLTMLYVTHDRLEALELSHKMAILDQGKLIQMGTPEEIRRQPANEFVAQFIG